MALNPILDAYLRSDFFGRVIFLGLLFLSILSVVVLVYKIWLTRFVKQFSNEVEAIFYQKKRTPLNIDFKQITQKVGVPNPFLKLYQTLQGSTADILKKNRSFLQTKEGNRQPIYLSPTDIEQLGVQVSGMIHAEKKKLERYLFILPTVVSLAPLLGLLGTVWGISVTFSQLSSQTNILSNDAVLSGLAMALGTTVVGIVVAIPSLIAYNYLKQVIEDYAVRMDEFSSGMLSSIEMLYRAVDVR